MFAFLKRRKYKNRVRLSMSYLLGLDTQGYTSYDVLRLYPRVWSSFDTDFEKDTKPLEAAASVLTITFTDLIENHSPARERERMERYILHNKGTPKYAFENGIKIFTAQATLKRDMGELSEATYSYMVSEIIGALRGMDRNERASRRLLSPLNNAIGTSS